MKPYSKQPDGSFILHIRATPNAGRNKVDGVYQSADECMLKVLLKAVPEDGKANKELIKFIAKSLKLTQNNISLIRGSKHRHKTLNLTSVSEQELQKFIESQ